MCVGVGGGWGWEREQLLYRAIEVIIGLLRKGPTIESFLSTPLPLSLPALDPLSFVLPGGIQRVFVGAFIGRLFVCRTL